MKRLLIACLLSLISVAAVAQRKPLTLDAGTPVHVRLQSQLDSKTSRAGDGIALEVTEPVVVDGVTIIKSGAPAHGEVTEAKRAGRVGHGAKLAFSILDVKAVDGQRVLVSASPHRAQGTGSGGVVTAGVVATAIIAWPVAPLWLLKHGHETEVNSGTAYMVYVAGDMSFDADKLSQITRSYSAPAAAMNDPTPKYGSAAQPITPGPHEEITTLPSEPAQPSLGEAARRNRERKEQQ